MGEDIRPLSKKDLTKFLETMRFSIMSSFLLLMSGPTYFAGGEDDGQGDIHLHFQMNEQSGGDTAVANEQQKDEDGGEDKPEKEEQGNDYSGDDYKGDDNSDSKGAGKDYTYGHGRGGYNNRKSVNNRDKFPKEEEEGEDYGSYNPQYRENRRRPRKNYPPPTYYIPPGNPRRPNSFNVIGGPMNPNMGQPDCDRKGNCPGFRRRQFSPDLEGPPKWPDGRPSPSWADTRRPITRRPNYYNSINPTMGQPACSKKGNCPVLGRR